MAAGVAEAGAFLIALAAARAVHGMSLGVGGAVCGIRGKISGASHVWLTSGTATR